MDRRLTPANGRVAAKTLQGQVQADRFVEGEPASVTVPVLDLRAESDGARDRQVLYGAQVSVFERVQEWAFVQAKADGYVGYVRADGLAAPSEATHRVSVPATHLYSRPDIKEPEHCWLSFGSQVRIVSGTDAFFETDTGLFVPKPHVRPLNAPFADAVTVAQLHFGAPYLWGGNSLQGIDCSGLIQAALLAAGLSCPGDSDLQESALGERLDPSESLRRGDLLFWKGHVAICVDEATLIHANAHHMAVAYEPIDDAIGRIDAAGDGPVTARKRLSRPPG